MEKLKSDSAGGQSSNGTVVRQADYFALASFRYALRSFLAFSQQRAKEAGLTPQQHQSLLAIKGFSGEKGLSVTDLATYMLLKHHSAVELVDRLEKADLVVRVPDKDDRRFIRLELTPKAEGKLVALSARHLIEIGRNAPHLIEVLTHLSAENRKHVNK